MELISDIYDDQVPATGSVRGFAPHFTCLKTDNWAAESAEEQEQIFSLPRAVIPKWLGESDQRESLETDANGRVLRGRALHTLPKVVLTDDGAPEKLGDGQGDNQEQAQALFTLGEEAKAQRLACCRRFGRRMECASGHAFRQTFTCGLRFCRACAPRVFRELFEKHVNLNQLVHPQRGWVLARLDFTVRNTGQMPTGEAIRSMNRAVRKVLRRLLKGRKGWGFLWCDEFGWENTNLHAHGLYYGPYLPQECLVEAWLEVTGDSRIVSIKSARWDFRRALRHLLKYVSKPPGEDPQHLARLEAAFSGVRRVHALGIFYNADVAREDEPSGDKELNCPCCGSHLFLVGAYCPVTELGGLLDFDAARREMARTRAFGVVGP